MSGRVGRLPEAWFALLLLGMTGGDASAQGFEPFVARNLSPLVAIFGLPAWKAHGEEGRDELAVVTEFGNHYRFSRRGPDTLILDGETWRTSFSFQRTLNEAWSIGIDLPFYQHSRGWLDGLVDAWHTAFDLPDGGRDNRPEDLLEFRLLDRDGVQVLLVDRSRGVGDVQLSAARAVGGRGRFTLRGTVKLATGDVERLTGSGGIDVAVTLMERQSVSWRGRPAGFYWGAGVLAVGAPENLAYPRESVVWLGLLGGAWQPWPRAGLKAQLDLHSPFYDSPLEELGQTSVQATIGAWRSLGERGVLEMAVGEDLHVSTAPDVVLQVGFRWRL